MGDRWLVGGRGPRRAATLVIVLAIAAACTGSGPKRIELGPDELGVGVYTGAGESGVVVGHRLGATEAGEIMESYAWDTVTGRRRTLALPDTFATMVTDVDARGRAVGSIWPRGGPYRSFLWDTGTGAVTYLPATAPWPGVQARAISDRGVLAGGVQSSPDAPLRAARWASPTAPPQVLDPLPGLRSMVATGISPSGRYVIGCDNGDAIGCDDANGSAVSFVWDTRTGAARVLDGGDAEARGVNDAGVVVGSAMVDGRRKAVRWEAAGGGPSLLRDLGGSRSEARAINNAGVVAGESDPPGGSTHVYRLDLARDRATDLGRPDVTFTQAIDLTARGRIYGLEFRPDCHCMVRWDP